MSDPLLDDSDLTLIINKEKIKKPDQSSTTEIKEINISIFKILNRVPEDDID